MIDFGFVVLLFFIWWLVHATFFAFLFKAYEKNVFIGVGVAICPSIFAVAMYLDGKGSLEVQQIGDGAYNLGAGILLFVLFALYLTHFVFIRLLDPDRTGALGYNNYIEPRIWAMKHLGVLMFAIPILGIILAIFFGIRKYFMRWEAGAPTKPERATLSEVSVSTAKKKYRLSDLKELIRASRSTSSSLPVKRGARPWAPKIGRAELSELLLIVPEDKDMATIFVTPLGPSFKMTLKEARKYAHKIMADMNTVNYYNVIFAPFFISFPLLFHPLTALIFALVCYSLHIAIRNRFTREAKAMRIPKFPGSPRFYDWPTQFKAFYALKVEETEQNLLMSWGSFVLYGLLVYGLFYQSVKFPVNFYYFYTFDLKLFEQAPNDLGEFFLFWYILVFCSFGALFLLMHKVFNLYSRIKLGRMAEPRDVIPKYDERLSILRKRIRKRAGYST